MRLRILAVLGVVAASTLFTVVARSCPFCSAVSMTFCEEIGQADASVIARLVEVPPQSADPTQNATASVKPSRFEILEILKGEEFIGKEKHFETLYFGAEPVGKEFLVMAINEKPKLAWATPIAITPAVRPYLKKALELPKSGGDRLAFFQDYLEGSEEMLARDAYDEFAKAPYADVMELKDRMKHDELVEWIKDPKVTPSHRRLYLTMLGVCGNAQDAAMLEAMLKDDSPAGKPGMDAMVAAYLKLKGPDGVALVEDLFLKNADAEYTETYAAIMALRFHGQEEKVIPQERLVEALRHMLDRPQLADLVIPDLARWEDWGSVDKLVELFKNSDDDSGWVRVPVINFLRVCPLPEAKEHLKELAKIDPESIKRADSFFPLGGAVPAATETPKAKEKKEPAAAAGKGEADASADEIPDASKFVEPGEQASLARKKPAAEAQAAILPTAERPVAAAAALVPSTRGAGAGQLALSTNSVMGALALAGLSMFLVMAAIVRGGQYTA